MKPRPPAALVFFGLSACIGGLENDPFSPGFAAISGKLEGAIDPQSAWVSVLGHEELRSGVDARGRFELFEVPSGELVLAGSTGEGRAAQMSVHLYRERPLEIVLLTEPALSVVGRVLLEASFGDASPRSIRVIGLPVQVNTDSAGRFAISGLFAGCHQIRAEHPGFDPVQAEICGESGAEVVSHPALRHSSVHLGRSCSPCALNTDCESGLCASQAGEHFCAVSCDSAPCGEHELICSPLEAGGSACLPIGTSCAALSDLLEATRCSADEDCGLHGTEDGVCLPAGSCSVRCEQQVCPAGHSCMGGGGHPMICF